MLDNLFGRPSNNLRRIEVYSILALSVFVLNKPRKHWFLSLINRYCVRVAPWRIILATLSASYLIKHMFLLLFLSEPQPLNRMYTRNFFRATWIVTALDAGFFSAMNVRPDALRHFLSVVLSVYYLFNADSASEKVRKYRAVATIQMMRISWEKMLNPIFRVVTMLDRGWLTIRENISFPRPAGSHKSPSSFGPLELGDIKARLYFNGNKTQLAYCTELIFHIPGGGFVTMSPECHDDYVSQWAKKTGKPIVSINYGKSPEHPYPYALEEIYDAYRAIVLSNGKVIGFSGWTFPDSMLEKKPIKIVLSGDSAGGNLCVGLLLKTLEPESVLPPTPTPCGVMLLYPCLSLGKRAYVFNASDMACWMPPMEMSLLRTKSIKEMRDISCVIQAKEDLALATRPLSTPIAPKSINVLSSPRDTTPGELCSIRPSLSMTSRMSYFQDRLLSPELMRAMALLYLNGSPVPYNVTEDMYLSPALTVPLETLERFPPVYFLTGEKDPLVDDTVVFAARIRQAKERRVMPKQHAPGRRRQSDTKQEHGVHVRILEGFSHAFFNMVAFLPEARQAIRLTSDWYADLFADNAAPRSGSAGIMNGKSVKEDSLLQRRRDGLASQHLEEHVDFTF